MAKNPYGRNQYCEKSYSKSSYGENSYGENSHVTVSSIEVGLFKRSMYNPKWELKHTAWCLEERNVIEQQF